MTLLAEVAHFMNRGGHPWGRNNLEEAESSTMDGERRSINWWQWPKTYSGLEVSFERRDEAITRFRDHEEVVLWFEHDLFDQLQLIQILD
jgi:hypothetical protein